MKWKRFSEEMPQNGMDLWVSNGGKVLLYTSDEVIHRTIEYLAQLYRAWMYVEAPRGPDQEDEIEDEEKIDRRLEYLENKFFHIKYDWEKVQALEVKFNNLMSEHQILIDKQTYLEHKIESLEKLLSNRYTHHDCKIKGLEYDIQYIKRKL